MVHWAQSELTLLTLGMVMYWHSESLITDDLTMVPEESENP